MRAEQITRPTGILVGTMSSTASTRGVSTPPTRVGMTTTSAALDRLGEQPLVARRRVDDGDVVLADPVERLGEHPVGGRFDEAHPLEALVLGVLDPVGGAGLRVGVDQRGRAPARGGDRGQVHGGRGLADPTLECCDDDDHGGNVGETGGPVPGHSRSPPVRPGYWTSLTTDFMGPVMKFPMSSVVFCPGGLANEACMASASSKVSETTQKASGAEPSKLVSARPYS